MAYFEVTRISDLVNVIIPHFINYSLCSNKFLDSQLFKLGVELINNKSHLSPFNRINNIKASLNKGLSEN